MMPFLPNTVSSMTVQTVWPMQTILPITCSVRWKCIDEDGKLERKADMFTKRTIKPHQAVAVVDTASEALAVSISEKACVDMDYMSQLTGKTKEELAGELQGVIFRVPGQLEQDGTPRLCDC